MPTYQYECQGCKQRYEEILKIADMEKPCESPCPECKEHKIERRMFDCPMLTSGVDGQYRVPSDFNNHLKSIKSFYKGSTVNTW